MKCAWNWHETSKKLYCESPPGSWSDIIFKHNRPLGGHLLHSSWLIADIEQKTIMLEKEREDCKRLLPFKHTLTLSVTTLGLV